VVCSVAAEPAAVKEQLLYTNFLLKQDDGCAELKLAKQEFTLACYGMLYVVCCVVCACASVSVCGCVSM
jgi:hypothetical protein